MHVVCVLNCYSWCSNTICQLQVSATCITTHEGGPDIWTPQPAYIPHASVVGAKSPRGPHFARVVFQPCRGAPYHRVDTQTHTPVSAHALYWVVVWAPCGFDDPHPIVYQCCRTPLRLRPHWRQIMMLSAVFTHTHMFADASACAGPMRI